MTSVDDALRGYWLVACDSRSLRKRPIDVRVLGTPLVLCRTSTGLLAAEDRCPHRNAPLSRGVMIQDRLQCPYHGWCFDSEGRCVEAPGMEHHELPSVGLRRWQAHESDGWIWVTCDRSQQAPSFYRPSIADDSAYRGFHMNAKIEANFADALENLLDGTHTPFVHAGVVRGSASQQSFTATVRRSDSFIEAEYRGESGQNGWISRLFEPEREVSFGRYVPPCTAELEYRSRKRIELLVVARFTPTLTGQVAVFITCYLPNGLVPAALRYAVVRPFFRHVLHQDIRMLQLQQRNIARFGGPSYVHWKADLLRPWIDAWLRDGSFPSQAGGPSSVQFLL